MSDRSAVDHRHHRGNRTLAVARPAEAQKALEQRGSEYPTYPEPHANPIHGHSMKPNTEGIISILFGVISITLAAIGMNIWAVAGFGLAAGIIGLAAGMRR
ncbi:MAG: hypothetical protein ABF966_04250 [Bifidobacterium psychraerophilum]|uniref:hypothetical protein n=1 Tax=Bifidobacterium psychraerophilum TaxID=218140 RepID=UPI0039E9FDAF